MKPNHPRLLLAATLVFTAFLATSDQTRAETTPPQFTMYGAEFKFDGAFSTVNVANGSLTPITSNSGGFYAGLDFQPATNTLWAVAGSLLYTVNPATGRPLTTRLLSGVGGSDIFSLSFAPDGTLYGLGNGNGNLYTVDTLTATTSFIGTSNQSIFGLEFGPGGVLYGSGFDLYEINPANGAAVDRGPLVTGGFALLNDLDFAPNGVMYGVTGKTTSDSLYSVDLAGATATLIGVTGGDLRSIASVPEPSAFVLLALGGLSLLAYTRIQTLGRSEVSA